MGRLGWRLEPCLERVFRLVRSTLHSQPAAARSIARRYMVIAASGVLEPACAVSVTLSSFKSGSSLDIGSLEKTSVA